MKKTEVKKIKGKGFGVVATKDIKKGEIISVSPYLVIPYKELKIFNKMSISAYCFACGKTVALAMDDTSFLNHSYDPNAYCKESCSKDRKMKFVARRNIKRDEEITINYNGNPENKNKLWFTVK